MNITEIADDQFEDHVLTKVTEYADSFELNHDGLCLGLDKKYGIVPKAGDTARFYGKGFGFTVRGVAINGTVAYYKTEAEERAEHDAWCASEKAKKIADYEAKKDDYARRVAALPPQLAARFARFAKAKDGWWPEYGPYELFCCEQAALFAATFKDPEELRSWSKLPYAQQRERLPGLGDGHSGNTFGFSVRLAHWLLTNPENAARDHGALVMLVGCDAYGCEHSS